MEGENVGGRQVSGSSWSGANAAGALAFGSPKRNRRMQSGWEGFFPYYAGFPETFARDVLQSSQLPAGSTVLDPWNGSGTTTYAAAHLGHAAVGYDLNPAMVVIAQARLLSPNEADSLRPLAASIVAHLRSAPEMTEVGDPLLDWFVPETAATIRGLEAQLRRTLVGGMTVTSSEVRLGRLSGTAATLYVALFAACRALAARFRTSNPTWTRRPRQDDELVRASRVQVVRIFAENVRGMAAALAVQTATRTSYSRYSWDVDVVDTTSASIEPGSVDFVLTSPPYCTRIDYTAATRIELALLHPLIGDRARNLARSMTGSICVPDREILVDASWGPTCALFLERVRTHPSRASGGYYYKTHLDYFHKMSRSLSRIAGGLKADGLAVVVVQDSHYKEVRNDLPTMFGEMGAAAGLELVRSDCFEAKRSMAQLNRHRRANGRSTKATEAVLCFVKS